MRAGTVCYQLSNLLLYKHELLLSKCPLTADWLLIRPVWNEISNEPLNYDPIPEHIISHTYTLPLSLPFCLFRSFYLAASSLPASSPCGCSFHVLCVSPHLTPLLSLLSRLSFRAHAACNCSGRSDRCVFDMEQYRSTGSGGRCASCRDNTDGPHCERCRENHHRGSSPEPCLPCNCDIDGKLQEQKT